MNFRNVFICVILFLVFPLTAFSENYEITGEARLEEAEGSYIICIDIKSNLPEGVSLEVEVYYAKKYFVHPRLRKPEQPEYDIEQVQIIQETASVTKEVCTIKIGNYKRRPYVGNYLVKVIFNPDDQPEEISQNLPDNIEPVETEISFVYGKPEELEEQKKQIKREIYGVMEQIKESYQALVQKVSKQPKEGKFDAEKWKEWASRWKETLEEIKQDNESRREGWIYRLETVGKHSIEALCIELTKFAEQYEKKAKSTDNLKSIESEFASLSQNFKEFFEFELQRVGLGSVPNKPVVKSIMNEIEKHLGLINNLVGNQESDLKEWQKKAPGYQDVIQRELFKLANETSDYIFATYTVPFTQDFVKYLEECTRKIKGEGDGKEINLLFKRLKKTLNDIKETLELD